MELTEELAEDTIQRIAKCAGLGVAKITPYNEDYISLEFDTSHGDFYDYRLCAVSYKTKLMLPFADVLHVRKTSTPWKHLLQCMLDLLSDGHEVFVYSVRSLGVVEHTKIELLRPNETLETLLVSLDLHEVSND